MTHLTSQLGQLGIAYLCAAAGMFVALWLSGADKRAYWRWPVYSAMALALGVILWNLLRKHAFPGAWLDSRLLYGSALAMYALLGLSLGLLLGRVTRPSRPFGGEDHESK